MTGGKSLKQLSSPEHEQTHICTRLVNHYRPSCSHRLLNGNWIAFLVLQNFPPSTQICVQSFANEYGLHNQALTPRKGRDFSPIIMLGMTLASVSPLHSEYRGNYLWKKAAGGWKWPSHTHLEPRLWMGGALTHSSKWNQDLVIIYTDNFCSTLDPSTATPKMNQFYRVIILWTSDDMEKTDFTCAIMSFSSSFLSPSPPFFSPFLLSLSFPRLPHILFFIILPPSQPYPGFS